eukprot:13896104-Heterocapsa_arctica.AAC.1
MRARSGTKSGADGFRIRRSPHEAGGGWSRSSSLGSGEGPAEVSLSTSAHLPGAGGRGGARRSKVSENRASCFA